MLLVFMTDIRWVTGEKKRDALAAIFLEKINGNEESTKEDC